MDWKIGDIVTPTRLPSFNSGDHPRRGDRSVIVDVDNRCPTIRFDDGEEYRSRPGLIDRWHPREEWERVRQIILDDGWSWKEDHYGGGWSRDSVTYHARTPDEPVSHIIESFGSGLKCCECGHLVETRSYVSSPELVRDRLCFHCAHWMRLFKERDNSCVIVANDTIREHFMIGSGNSRFRGFGGRGFKIRFTNGQVVATNDLWFQGDIPEHFWDRFPVNAEFVRD